MPYGNNYGNGGQSRRPGGYPQSGRQSTSVPEITAKPLPADYVDEAERVIRKFSEGTDRITTSKLRNLLSLVSGIYNRENLRTEKELLPESVSALGMMRIRTVYEAGRDDGVKAFVRAAAMLEYIKGIGTDRQKLIDFAHYMEALVAYHRFIIGGKEG